MLFENWVRCSAVVLIVTPFAMRAAELVRPSVVVVIATDSEIAAFTLEQAQNIASGLLREGGLKVRWMRCKSVKDEASEQTSFAIELRVLSRPFPGTEVSDDALGFTLVRVQPPHAAVFYDRVLRAARLHDSPVHVVLACAMAHEIGHALLGSTAHASRGLMRGNLTKSDFRLAAQGLLLLSSGEASAIRRGLAKRTAPTGEKRIAPTGDSRVLNDPNIPIDGCALDGDSPPIARRKRVYARVGQI